MSKAFLFPGQASQQVHMGEDLYHGNAKAKELFAAAEEIIPGLLEVCFGEDQAVLNQTKFAQPAVVAVSAVLWETIPKEFRDGYVTGHSLGEYSALYAAGVLGFSEVLRLVRERALVMARAAEKVDGGMVAVMGLEFAVIAEMISELELQDRLYPANRNSERQTVLSGSNDAISRLSTEVIARGGKAVPLGVSGPFHSPFISEAGEQFSKILRGYSFAKPQMPFVSATTASEVQTTQEIKQVLIRQFTSPVLWIDTIGWLGDSGVNTVVEVGPGKVLTGLVKRIDSRMKRLNVSTLNEVSGLPVE